MIVPAGNPGNLVSAGPGYTTGALKGRIRGFFLYFVVFLPKKPKNTMSILVYKNVIFIY